MRDDCRPASQVSKKADLVEWLLEHGARDAEGELCTNESLAPLQKKYLWVLCQANKPEKQIKLFDWLHDWNEAHGTDIRLNILPIAHPQLNPIELVWNWVETHVGTNNHDFSMSSIHDLAQAKAATIDSVMWTKACDKADRIAADNAAADDIMLDGAEGEGEDDGASDDGDGYDEGMYGGGGDYDDDAPVYTPVDAPIAPVPPNNTWNVWGTVTGFFA